MSRIAAILFFVFIGCLAHGQANKKCPEYEKCLERAAHFLKSEKTLEAARREYLTAKIFAKECEISDTLADKGIEDVINKYKSLTQYAEKARKDAVTQKELADSLREKAERTLSDLEENTRKINNLDKALEEAIKKERKRKGEDTSAAAIAAEKNKVLLSKRETDNSSSNDVQTPVNTIRNNDKLSESYAGSILYIQPFVQTKYVVDSILNSYNLNGTLSNSLDDESSMALLLDRLENDYEFNIVAKKLYDSTKNELKEMVPGTSQFDFTVYTYLKAALYTSWYWTEKTHCDTVLAKTILDEAAIFCTHLPYKSAIIYSGMAGLYNSYHQYYSTINNNKQAFEDIKTAIDFSTNAIKLNPDNYLYHINLATLLRNATYIPDSLLSKIDKVELARLAYQCVKNMEIYFPRSTHSLTELCNSSLNLSNRLMNAGYNTNAVDTLVNTLEVVNQHIEKKTVIKDIEINKLKLLIKAAVIYVDSLKNYPSGLKYLNESYSLFNSINQNTSDNDDTDRLVELNSSLDNLLRLAKNKQDSLSTITTFSGAIQAFEKISPLGRSEYKAFSEHVNLFVRPYVKRLELNLIQNNQKEAEKDFITLEKTFFPYYYKYRFDFYLGQSLIRASKLYANYLSGKGNYRQALPLLKFTSLEGSKESTDSLIAIYQKPGFANADSLKFYKDRTSYQSNGVKRFTVPTDFNGEKFPFHIYITDRAKEYDTRYTGIRDQAEWVWEARQGKIPDDVISSFDKLQQIAWENDVSFMDLSIYALGAAREDISSNEKDQLRAEVDEQVKGRGLAGKLKVLQNYIFEDNTFAVEYLTDQIINTDSVNNKQLEELKKELGYYQLLTEWSVDSLKLLNKEWVSICRNIFSAQNASYLSSNNLKREYYLKLTTLDSLYYLHLSPNEKIQLDSAIGAHYNSLAWYSFFTKEFSNVYDYLMLSKNFDSKSLYPDSNIPHYYLFTNQIEKAKTEYIRLKDKLFLPERSLPTYKHAFLADLEEFEKEGIYNEHFAEIKRLLNK